MLRIVRQRLEFHMDGGQTAAFRKLVDETLNPLISGVRREYFRRLGLNADEVESWMAREQGATEGPLALGDIVLRDRDTMAYFRAPSGAGWLEAGVITRNDPSQHKDFFDELLKLARRAADRKDLAWSPLTGEGDPAASLATEAVVVVPNPREIEAARELEQVAMQRLVGQILAAGSVFLTKFSQTLQQERAVTDQAISRFEDLGLVTKDFAVLCRKTGQQILRVSSRAAIEDPSQKTFKCFICGNSVSEEVLDEIITVTDFGRKLLERDHWLVVRMVAALEAVGIPSQQVRIQADDGNLVNIFVTVNDQPYLIVVANRKISLEESYLINAQVAAYRLAHVIVVCTERLSMLMRHHLEKSNPTAEFDFVDSLRGIEERIVAILARKEKSVLREVLANFASLTPVQVQDVVMQRISPEPATVESTDGRRKAAARASEEKPSSESEKPGRKNRAAKDEAPASGGAAEEVTSDGEFSMMGEVLEVDESMMSQMPNG